MTKAGEQPSTREQILGRAAALFMQQGISGTSLADIAAAAGISKGTLFYHFRSKDDLILEIATSHIEQLGQEVLAFLHQRGDTKPDLPGLLEHFLDAVRSATVRNKLHLYLLEEGISRNPAIRQALRDQYGEWQKTISEALVGYAGLEATQVAPLILALADGLIIQALLGRDQPALGAALRCLLRDVAAGER